MSVMRIAPSPCRFGLELEFRSRSFEQDDLHASLCRQTGLDIENTDYAHSEGVSWHLKPDSSCGLELASPAIHWDRWPEVERIVKALRKTDVDVTDQCGLHVHHEFPRATGADLRRLALLWTATEPAVLRLLSPDRASNRYCARMNRGKGSLERLKSSVIPCNERTLRDALSEKYMTLSFRNWWRNSTVEFRAHQGTLSLTRIALWTAFTQKFVERSRESRGINELIALDQITAPSAAAWRLQKLHEWLDDDTLSQYLNTLWEDPCAEFLESSITIG